MTEATTLESLDVSETLVYCRTSKRLRTMATHKAAHAVLAGLVDLAGPGSLPLDPTLRPGDRTLGDGEGCAFVVTVFASHVQRLRLTDALRMVRSNQARYVNRDGSPLVLPVVEPVIVAQEPALVSHEPAPPLQSKPKPSLFTRAVQLAATIL